MSEKRRWRVTRRGFLIGAGATGGVLALGVGLGLPRARLAIANQLDGATAPGDFAADPDLWFEVPAEGRVRLYVPKTEMGQGIHTALGQIGGSELGLSLDALEVVQATTQVGPPDPSGTQGSASVVTSYAPLREAAAALRQMLRAAASQQLGQPEDQLVQEGPSFVVAGDPATRISFNELAAAQSEWVAPEEVTLKPDAELALIGEALPRPDIPGKVTGQTIYGYDARLDGMRYGAIARPPTIEAQLVRLRNQDEISAMPGVEMVVVNSDINFAGVVAESRWQAWQARDAMDIEWREGKRWQQAELEEIVTVGGRGGVVIQQAGNAPGNLGEGALASEYRTPLATHAPMEPQAALAEVTDESVRVWVSTQMQARTAEVVAEGLGRGVEGVEVIPTYLGGGFGRKGISLVAVEAARLAEAAGTPVHVGWTREEEMRHGYLRPLTQSSLRGRVEGGRLVALEHQQASADVLFAYFPAPLRILFGVDFGAWRGSRIPYEIENRRVVAWRRQIPVQTGPWRGLGLLANTFALESFIDELAHVAGADPLAFRLNHLTGEEESTVRLRAALEAVRDLSRWGEPVAEGRTRGVACCLDAGTAVAQVVEISMVEGKLRVHEVWAVMDCGQVINPSGATAQVEGNVMWGVGSSLLESVRIEDGRVALSNFDSYPLLTLAQAPNVTVQLINPTGAPPGGAGEPAIGPVAAAIGNALFVLDGERRRTIPFV